jgi:hypothetical protein
VVYSSGFPWWLAVSVGVVALFAAGVVVFLRRRARGTG